MRKITLVVAMLLAGCATQKELEQKNRENNWRQSESELRREAWNRATGGQFQGGTRFGSSNRPDYSFDIEQKRLP